jgi:hypothetical protein
MLLQNHVAPPRYSSTKKKELDQCDTQDGFACISGSGPGSTGKPEKNRKDRKIDFQEKFHTNPRLS